MEAGPKGTPLPSASVSSCGLRHLKVSRRLAKRIKVRKGKAMEGQDKGRGEEGGRSVNGVAALGQPDVRNAKYANYASH